MSRTTAVSKALDVKKFEGLLCRYPMHREGNRVLYWTIQHFSDESYGAYEVFVGKRKRSFTVLKDAVDYFNGGKNT